MTDVVIVEAGRSPIGKRNGSLAGAHPADVLGPVMMEVDQAGRYRLERRRPGRRRLHQQGRRPGDEHHPHRLAEPRRRRGSGGHHRRRPVRQQPARGEHRLRADRQRCRRRRARLRGRGDEPASHRQRRGRRSQGRLRQAGQPHVLRALRVHQPVRGRRTHGREVRHQPPGHRRPRPVEPGAGRDRDRRGSVRDSDHPDRGAGARRRRQQDRRQDHRHPRRDSRATPASRSWPNSSRSLAKTACTPRGLPPRSPTVRARCS